MVERILILGMTPLAEQVLREIARHPGGRHVVVGVLDDVTPPSNHFARHLVVGRLRELQQVVESLRPDRVVVALAERRGTAPMRALLEVYVSHGLVIEDVTEFYERFTGKLALEWLTPMRVIASRKFQPSPLQRYVARVTSCLVALAALMALAPLLAVIAIAIKLDSPGPVFFTQKRVGLLGRPFTLLKFRTMRTGARRSEWEGDNRDHVTGVGKWLRRFRLDELPQFVNVLRGEMNLVGPRPHPVTNLELFTLVARNLSDVAGFAIGCYALRLVVPPGITGWAQVRYRYANNLDEEIEKLRYDLHYVKHMSLWLDLRILAETIGVMVHGHRAEESGSANTMAIGPARAWKVLTRLGLALLFALPAPAYGQTQGDVPEEVPPAKYEYVIGPADVLEIAVWQNELISRTVPVRPDGKISLPVLNDVQAAGLTPTALKQFLSKALTAYIQTPEVSVIVREVHSFNISVIGHVKTPGRYELTSRVTVLDALAMAGGLTDYADRGKILVLRRDGADTKQIPFAYDKLTPGNGSKGQSNFFVQPDDIIFVR
ncbi:MAG TPA: exopolysaccharide biosynthesis polyprenyl glycosylphosphotransferase [Vicinamibacterales bacterium]|nr:exopolysaccharide biosynthesis polyprenyl glycosylphosphotransferase [Vicinamibacterales bacterium]